MNLERLNQLIDSYGADERRWPRDLRGEMLALVDAHPEVQQSLIAARNLDLLLDSYQPDVEDLTARIVDAVPRTGLERFLEWLLPRRPANWWRPVLAGATPFVLGIAIGLGESGAGLRSDSAGTDWEQQERALLSPTTLGVWYE